MTSSQVKFDATVQGQLNSIKDVKDTYPSANLLDALLRQICININTAPRNVHTAAQIFHRSSAVYKAIIATMQKLDACTEETINDYLSLFDNYTTAIPILENILTKLPHATLPLDDIKGHLPPDTSTEAGISFIKKWAVEREGLKKALEDLKHTSLQSLELSANDAKLLISDYIEQRRKDDDTILKSMNAVISKHALNDKNIIKEGKTTSPTLLADVKKLVAEILKTLSTKPQTEEVNAIVVHSCMLVYIPFVVHSNAATDKGWKRYLEGAKIWVKIKELLTKVKAYIDDPTAPGQSKDFTAIFDEVEKLLLNLGEVAIDTGSWILALIKLSAQMHRPYSGRTASIVKTLYRLDQTSRLHDKKKFNANRFDLKQIMEKIHGDLTTIKGGAYDFKTFTLESDEYKKNKSSIKTLFKEVEPLYTTFEHAAAWPAEETAFDQCVTTDENHVKDGQKFLNKQ